MARRKKKSGKGVVWVGPQELDGLVRSHLWAQEGWDQAQSRVEGEEEVWGKELFFSGISSCWYGSQWGTYVLRRAPPPFSGAQEVWCTGEALLLWGQLPPQDLAPPPLPANTWLCVLSRCWTQDGDLPVRGLRGTQNLTPPGLQPLWGH